MKMPMAFFSQRMGGDILQRQSSNAAIAGTLVNTFAPLLLHTVMMFFYLFVMLRYSVMLTLVGAGYGIGFAIASQVQTLQRPDISIRPLAGSPPVLSTYLLRRRGEPSEPMKRFIERAKGGRDRACR